MLGSLRKIARGLVAGTLATFIFHQGALLVLKMAGLVPDAQPWSLAPAGPFHIPAIALVALFGGLWGVVIALTFADIPGDSAFVRGAIGGLLGPGVVGTWTIVPWMQSLPMFAGGDVKQIALTALIYMSYGFGTGLFLFLLDKRKAEKPSRRRVLI